MKKRFLAIAITIIVMLSMVACNDTDELSNDYIIVHKYLGLIISDVEPIEVTEDMIDEVISDSLRESITTREVTDRPAQFGDEVIIDFEGSVDGVLFDGGAASEVPLTLGSGALIGPYGGFDGFEEQIVGHASGSSFDIEVMFPEDYHAPDLAGAVAVFAITIHSIIEVLTPEINDEWVRGISQHSNTIEEFREEIRADAEEHFARVAIEDMQSAALGALMREVELKQPLPQEAIDEEMEIIMDFYRDMAVSYGMEFEDFLAMSGVDEDGLREIFAEDVEDAVKRRFATDLIAEREGLVLSEEEFRERMEYIAERGGFGSVEDYIARFGEALIRASIQQLVVAEFLVEHAELVSEDEFREMLREREQEGNFNEE